MKVPSAQFSTDQVERPHGYEAWRQMLSASHEVVADDDGFSGSVTSTRVGGMVVHVMRASAQSTLRSARQVRRDGLEHFVLHVNAAPAVALAGDTEVRVPAGGISVNDLSQPSRRSAVPELGSIIVSLSRDLVAEARGFTDGLHGTILEHGAGALLGSHIRSLGLHAREIEQHAAASVARGTAELFVACLDPSRANLERAREGVETAALQRARRYVEANLARLDLTPELVGHAAGVSRSTLFRLFQPSGGVARYITARRLHSARRLLGQQRGRHGIAQVAAQCGFASEAHFSREFKRQFGMSPSDAFDVPAAGVSTPALAPGGFFDWVRALG